MLEIKTNKKQQVRRNRLLGGGNLTITYVLKGKRRRIPSMKPDIIKNEHRENQRESLKQKI